MSEIETNAAKVETGHGLCLTALAELPDAALLNDQALGKALRVHPKTIRRMAARHELPPGIRQAGKTLWLAGKVRAWIAGRAEQAEKKAKGEIDRTAKMSS